MKLCACKKNVSSMRQFTTAADVIAVDGVDLSAADVYVTYVQGKNELTIEDPEVEYAEPEGLATVGTSTVKVGLDQLQTGEFKVGVVKRQVNWVTEEGRWATDVVTVQVKENLLKEEKTFGGGSSDEPTDPTADPTTEPTEPTTEPNEDPTTDEPNGSGDGE